MHVFRPKRGENHTFWGGTYWYGLYQREYPLPLPPGPSKVSKLNRFFSPTLPHISLQDNISSSDQNEEPWKQQGSLANGSKAAELDYSGMYSIKKDSFPLEKNRIAVKPQNVAKNTYNDVFIHKSSHFCVSTLTKRWYLIGLIKF